MNVRRSGVSIGVLGGVIYAVGGHDGSQVYRSVEAYRSGTENWITVADMHLCRRNAGDYSFNDYKLFKSKCLFCFII